MQCLSAGTMGSGTGEQGFINAAKIAFFGPVDTHVEGSHFPKERGLGGGTEAVAALLS